MIEGKTKIVSNLDNNNVLIVNKDTLTAGDGVRNESLDVAAYKTTQMVNVFKLLTKEGISNAFIDRISDVSVECHKCDMLPIEFIARRYAFGSYLKRRPYMKRPDPMKFEYPTTELFHKYSVVIEPDQKPYIIPESDARKQFLRNGEWKFVDVYTDPFIVPNTDKWYLHPNNEKFDIWGVIISIDPVLSFDELSYCLNELLTPCFLALENAWSKVETKHGPVTLVDLKIEIGKRLTDNKLVIADTITNDEWRIWPGGDPKQQLDKQCFRDGNDLSSVEEKYELVAKLTDQFI
jgi:phosphoribosylaminoimidazole-succinocarboxamide synthase